MPIVSTVTISKEIYSLKFNRDGSLEVILIVSDGTDQQTQETHNFTSDILSGILDVAPPAGYTMRQAIISAIYIHLVTSGVVAGEIQA